MSFIGLRLAASLLNWHQRTRTTRHSSYGNAMTVDGRTSIYSSKYNISFYSVSDYSELFPYMCASTGTMTYVTVSNSPRCQQTRSAQENHWYVHGRHEKIFQEGARFSAKTKREKKNNNSFFAFAHKGENRQFSRKNIGSYHALVIRILLAK